MKSHYKGCGQIYLVNPTETIQNHQKEIEKRKFVNSWGIKTWELPTVKKFGFNPRK
jgi:hypothetical protein